MAQAYVDFTSQFAVLSVNFMPYLSASCLFPPMNFYAALTVQTLGPIGVAFLLMAHYMYSVRRVSGDDDAQHKLKTKLAARLLWLSYLVFPGTSQTVLQAFACTLVNTVDGKSPKMILLFVRCVARTVGDDDFDENEAYLKYDYSLSCTTPVYLYGWKIFAIVMVAVYPFGVPCVYLFLVYRSRHYLNPEPWFIIADVK